MEKTMKTGVVFDLKRFAVHDGSGLRSTLFLKGCPLRCPWCQNPEGLTVRPLLMYASSVCLRCGTCVHTCHTKALSLRKTKDGGPERVHVERNQCNLCKACVRVCPAAALTVKGEEISSQEAAQRLLRDRVFFREGGGVTLSGGECLMQWAFSSEVLGICKEQGVDTAIETCLLAPREAVDAMLPVVDHFLTDIKYLDAGTHRQVLGADNRQILDNYRYLVEKGADVLVRTPLIPGFNAKEENVRAIAAFVYSVNPDAKMELLNYNPLCISKYESLEEVYPVQQSTPLSASQMGGFYRILEEEGIKNIVRE